MCASKGGSYHILIHMHGSNQSEIIAIHAIIRVWLHSIEFFMETEIETVFAKLKLA